VEFPSLTITNGGAGLLLTYLPGSERGDAVVGESAGRYPARAPEPDQVEGITCSEPEAHAAKSNLSLNLRAAFNRPSTQQPLVGG